MLWAPKQDAVDGADADRTRTDVNRTEKDKAGEDGADDLSSSTSNTENIQQQQR